MKLKETIFNNYLTKILKKNKKLIKKFLVLFFSTLLMSFSFRYFILESGIYSSGIGGFSQGISYTITDLWFGGDDLAIKNIFYWVFYFFFNIPIIIFTLKYFGKKFASWSIYIFIISLLFSLFFNYTPGFKDVSIFGISKMESGPNRSIAITLSSIIGGFLYGVGIGFIFRLEASSLGLDPIGRYLAREKGKNLSIFFFTFSFVSSFFWTVVTKSIEGEIKSFDEFVKNVLFSIEIISTTIFLFLYSFIGGQIYNSSSKLMVEINTTKGEVISQEFNNLKYHRNHTIYKVKGGYTNAERFVIKIIVKEEEIKDVYSIVKRVDKDCFIYVIKLNKVFSNHLWNTFTLEDKKRKESKKK